MARGRKTSIHIELHPQQQEQLEAWLRSMTLRAGLVRRARIILLLAQGESISQISRTVGIRRRHTAKWTKRFLDQGIDGLCDKPGRGRKPAFPPSGGDPSGEAGLRKTG
jgi:hypothetical protein